MPGPHDLGGANFGPIDRADSERRDREKSIDAMQYTLRGPGYWCVDEMRRSDRIAAATELFDIHLLPKMAIGA
jgi:hypothetical protein